MDHLQPRVHPDVPGKALKRESPQQPCEHGADPHVAKAGLRVRNEVEHQAHAKDQQHRREIADGKRL